MDTNRSPRTWLRILSCALLLLHMNGCRADEAQEEVRVRVEAGPPRVQDVEVTLRYPIELAAAEKVAVSPVAVSGLLTNVLVDVGDKVSAGQTIAMVDCREYAAQRTQAETAISRWQAQEDETRAQLGRLLAMDQSKLVAPAEVDRARAAHRIAEAQLADARAKLSEATQRQGYCWLKSPFDGYVSERNLDPGAMVGPGGQPVVTIVKTRDVKVVANIIEQDAPKVRRGAEVDVTLHALPDTPFRGTVTRLGRALDPKTRTLTVEVDIPNAQETLLPGMTGRAAIVVGKRTDALLLPITALLNLEEASYVYVVREKDGKPRAHRVQVKLGVDLGDWLEVLEGISADDQVILVGRELVTDGTWLDVRAPADGAPAKDHPEQPTPERSTSSPGDAGSTGTAATNPAGNESQEAAPSKQTASENVPAKATSAAPSKAQPPSASAPQAKPTSASQQPPKAASTATPASLSTPSSEKKSPTSPTSDAKPLAGASESAPSASKAANGSNDD